ncbi:MAG: hypothetical protein BWZ01_01496 [Deltaproteobacteria bacterium ADurb.BinA179]|nr:MAG: hypothetical protein BWZ01_01496 [Deltaproteobacteria bacterium ADurb.BinA179]
MIVRQNPPGGVDEEEWYARLVHELPELLFTGRSAHAAAAQDNGFFSLVDQLGGLFDGLCIGLAEIGGAASLGPDYPFFAHLDVEDVGRKLQKHRPFLPGCSLSEGDVEEFGYAPDVVAYAVPFHRGLDHVGLLHLLQCPFLAVPHGRGAGNDYHGRIFEMRIHDAGQRIGKPRPCGDDADACTVLVYRPGMRHHCGGLFVPYIDQPHVLVEQTVVDPVDVPAGKREHHFHAFHLLQVFCHQVTAEDVRHKPSSFFIFSYTAGICARPPSLPAVHCLIAGEAREGRAAAAFSCCSFMPRPLVMEHRR